MALTFQLTVFSDPQGEAAARVYVVAVPDRAATADELANYRLSGQIIGPTCRYSSTLQTKIPFQHRGLTPCGDRTALLAEALVPDPCYWSTELPFLYRAVGQITGTEAGPTPFEQTFGIRSVGVLRNKLTFNGKVWVPRCVSVNRVIKTAISEWRESDTVMLVDAVDEALGRDASERGVRLMVAIDTFDDDVYQTLFRLGRYSAVTLISLGRLGPIDPQLQTANQNTLLGHFEDGKPFEPDDAAGFRLVVIGAGGMATGIKTAMATGLPLLAVRLIVGDVALTEARAGCDRTQREMAQIGEGAAGYIVI